MRTNRLRMPNGRPGDNPYTDIVTHDIDIPDKEVAEIVRDIDSSDNDRARRVAGRILWDAGVSSMGDDEPSDDKVAQLRSELSSLAAEVELSRAYAHESPLDACLADVDTVYSTQIRQLVQDIHTEIEEDVKNDWWVHRDLSAILWEFGWESEQLNELEHRLRAFRNKTVREHME